MDRGKLPPIVLSLLTSLGLAALLLCGLASLLVGLGFGIDNQGHWADYVSGGIRNGQADDTVLGLGRALPRKAECGSRWLSAQPEFLRMADLERQDRLDEAAAVCQRAAQRMLGCVSTSSVYGQCFRIDKKIVIQQCSATCDPIMCRAAKMTCDQ